MKNITKQLLVWLLAVLMVWPWPVRLDAQGLAPCSSQRKSSS